MTGNSTDIESLSLTIVGENDAVTIIEGESTLSDDTIKEIVETAPTSGFPGQLNAPNSPGESVTLHNVSGTIAFSDLDIDDTHSVSVNNGATTSPGGFVLGTMSQNVPEITTPATGGVTGTVLWNYHVLDASMEFLREGETVIETFVITVTDDSPYEQLGALSSDIVEVSVTITGSNDSPTFLVNDPVSLGQVSESDANLNSSALTLFGVEDLDVKDEVTLEIDVALSGDGAQSADPQNQGAFLNDGITTEEFEALIELSNDNSDPLDDSDDVANGSDNDVVITNENTTGTIFLGFNSGTDAEPTAFDYLSEGEELVVNITATVTDDSSLAGTDTETVTVTIVGENDAVAIVEAGSDFAGAVTEVTEEFPANPAQDPAETSTTLTDSGTINFVDVDLDDTHTVTVTGSEISVDNPLNTGPALGTLTFTVDEGAGLRDDNSRSFTWTYEVADGAVEFLSAGQTAVETFFVRLQDDSPHDGDGFFTGTTATVTVTITGTNDAPEILSGPGDATFSEDVANSFGVPGGSTIAPPFQVEDIDLRDEVTISLDVVVSGEGAEGASSGGTDPDDGLSAAEVESLLSLNGQDVDGQTVIDDQSTTGSVSLVFNDTTATTTDNVASNTVFDYLSSGEELIAEITGTITDNSGEENSTDIETVTVTIVGNNDDAFFNDDAQTDSFTLTGDVSEVIETFPAGPDGVSPGEATTDHPASGQVGFTDVDLDDTHSVEVVPVGTATPGNVPGPVGSLTFGTLTAVVAEDSTGDSAENNGVITWSYTVNDAAIEALGAGETAIETFNIVLFEDSPHDDVDGPIASTTTTVTVVITGQNDAPELLEGDRAATLVEGDEDGDLVGTDNDPDHTGPGIQDFGPLVATGSIAVRDLDTNDTVIAFVQSVDVSYDPANGDALGTASTDLPSDEVTEDQLLNMLHLDGGGLGGTNIDPGLFEGWVPLVIDNENTTGTLNWTFDSSFVDPFLLEPSLPDGPIPTNLPTFGFADFDYIAAGESLVLDYTVVLLDDSGATDGFLGSPSDFDETIVSITIVGTNDRPEIDDDLSVVTGDLDELLEDDQNETGLESTIFNTIRYRDVDISDVHVIQEIEFSNGAAADGSFVGAFDADVDNQLDDQVEWSLDVFDGEIEHLRVGETATQSYNVIVNDQNGGTDTTRVTVTFTGENDRPDITVVDSDSAAETLIEASGNETAADEGLAVSGTLSVEDIDIHDVVLASSVLLSSESDDLGQPSDEALNAMFTVDGTTEAAPVIIGGPNNAPGAGVANTGFADGATTGTITWSFDSGSESFDYLQDGQSLVIEYTVTATDNSDVAESNTDTQIVTITVIGTNDRPEIVAATLVDATLSEDNGVVGVDGDTGESITASGSFDILDRDILDEVNAEVFSVVATGNVDLPGSVSVPDNAQTLALLSLGDNNPEISTTETTGTVDWTFTSPAGLFDYLAIDEEVVLTYTVRMTDTSDQSDEVDPNDEPNFIDQLVTVTITGTNDTPFILTQTDVDSIAELAGPGAALETAGVISVIDFDRSDVVTIASVEVTGSGQGFDAPDPALAGVDLDAMFQPQEPAEVIDGFSTAGSINWTFNSGEFGFDYLNDGESAALTYTVTVTDDNGATDATDVVIVITGTNDGPTIEAGVVDATLDEPAGTVQTASGSFDVTDLDTTDVVTITDVTASVAGVVTGNPTEQELLDLGTLTPEVGEVVVDGTGNTATVNWFVDLGANGSNPFDYLAEGESAVVTYTVSVSDEAVTATQDITVTIIGTNDTPEILDTAGETERSLIENDDPQATAGVFTIRDLDLNDTVFISTALKSADGPVIGQPSDEELDNFFDAGETPVIRDLDGGTTGDVEWTFASTVASEVETFDYLDDGESLVLVYTVTASDILGAETEQDVTITITGTNDAPEFVGGDTTGLVEELAEDLEGTDVAPDATGTLDTVDLDLSDVNTASVTAVGTTLGELVATMNDDLTSAEESIDWAYSVDDADLDFLREGQEVTDQFTVTLTDDNGITDTEVVTITLVGANDAPVFDLDAVDLGNTDEDTANFLGGESVTTLTGVSDVDLLDSVELSLEVAATTDASTIISDAELLGFITIDPTAVIDGTETSDEFSVTASAPGNPFDYLSDGQELVVTYTVTATDDSGAANNTDTLEITGTITGVNDAFFMSDLIDSGDVTEVAEGGPDAEGTTLLTADGGFILDDLDLDDTYRAEVLPNTNEGVLELTQDGGQFIEWNFSVLDSAVEDLAEGQTQVETFEILFTETSPETGDQTSFVDTVTVTITGTNDTPFVSGAGLNVAQTLIESTAPVPGNDPLTAAGTLDVEDLDLIDSVDASAVLVSANGPAGQPADGVLEAMFSIDPEVDAVAVGDNSGTIDWTFASAPENFDYIAEGESLVLTYNVTVVDDLGATTNQDVVITVVGTNDAPIIGDGEFSATVFEIVEGGPQQETRVTSITRQIDFSDVDLSDTHAVFTDERGEGFVGTFAASVTDPSTGDGQGTADWTFQVSDAALAFIGEGETVVQEYDVQLVDFDGLGLSDTTVVSITLIGANDAPDAIAVDAGSVTEDEPQAIELLDPAFVSDPDINDDLDVQGAVVSVSDGRSIFTAVDNETGTVSIQPGQFEDLAVGESVTVNVDYNVTDGIEVVANTAALTITGVNDDPEIGDADDAALLVEANNVPSLDASGEVSFTDVDLSDEHDVSVTPAGGNTLGGSLAASVTSAATGGAIGSVLWEYSVSPALADGLAVDESAVEVFTLTVTDGNGGSATQDVTITVEGTNDAPTVVGTTAGADEGGAAVDIDLSVLGDDVDSDDDGTTLTYSIVTGPVEGSASITGTTLTFDPGTDFAGLSEGETVDVTVTIEATDQHGTVSGTADVVITVTGNGNVGAPGPDDDSFIATAVAENFDGGIGIDNVDYSNSDAAVIIELNVSASGGFAEGDTLTDIENIIGSNFNDILTGDGNTNVLFGSGGRDLLVGQDGADVLYGGDDIDALIGGAGADSLFGGDGDLDIIAYFEVQEDLVFDLRTGFDDVTNESSAAIKEDFIGDDIEAFAGSSSASNTFFIGDGAGFSLVLGGANSDTFFGGDATDQLIGLAGDDVLYGNAGVDALRGDNGNDDLFGGSEADFFLFDDSDGDDTIHDFEAGLDRINFFGPTISSVADLTVVDDGTDTVVSYVDVNLNVTSTITVLNATEQEVTDSFIF